MTTIYIIAIVGFCSIFGTLTALALWFGSKLTRDMAWSQGEQTILLARFQQEGLDALNREIETTIPK